MKNDDDKHRRIQVADGFIAIVPRVDFERVRQHRWYPQWRKGNKKREGTEDRVGGVRTQIGGKPVYLHRFVLGLERNGRVVDHWNGNVFDNRRCNLRICTYTQNALNRAKRFSWNSTSPYRGVSLKNKNFAAYFRGLFLGNFGTDEEAAARAYDAALRKAAGEFKVRMNFPRKDEIPPEPPSVIIDQEERLFGWRRTYEYVGVFDTPVEDWAWGLDGKVYEEGFSSPLDAAKARDAYILGHNLYGRHLSLPEVSKRPVRPIKLSQEQEGNLYQLQLWLREEHQGERLTYEEGCRIYRDAEVVERCLRGVVDENRSHNQEQERRLDVIRLKAQHRVEEFLESSVGSFNKGAHLLKELCIVHRRYIRCFDAERIEVELLAERCPGTAVCHDAKICAARRRTTERHIRELFDDEETRFIKALFRMDRDFTP